ncbi:hypothetical protein [Kineococcus arenarius]|uniref:hypothetical protein n=1 Tax=unclassified Kineococcus TaxID=2621656 RepID=UPI003D7CC563
MAAVVFELGIRFAFWYLRQVRRCWRAVSRWMTPRWSTDQHVLRLQAWRSWLGYASVAVAVGLSGDASSGLAEDMLQGALLGFALKAVVAVPVFLVGAAVVGIRTHRSQRRGRLLPALRPLGLLLTVIAVPVLLVAGMEWLNGQTAGSTTTTVAVAILTGGSLVLYVVWPFVLVAAVAIIVHGVRHLFCAGDVHPLLPSILAFVVALASGAENVSEALQPAVGVERTLSLLGVCGALTVLGLTVYEHHRLRRLGWRWADLRLPLHELPGSHPLRRVARGPA